MREQQNVEIVSLESMHTADVDMQTTVFVGSSTSSQYLEFMYTPRGYARKYDIK
jgi:precorrin-3B methylase